MSERKIIINAGTNCAAEIVAHDPADVREMASSSPDPIFSAIVEICRNLHVPIPLYAETDTLSGGGDDRNFCLGMNIPQADFKGQNVSNDLLILAKYKSYPIWDCPYCGVQAFDPYADEINVNLCSSCHTPLNLIRPEEWSPLEMIGTAAHEIRHIYQRRNGTALEWKNWSESQEDPNEVDADAYAMYWLMIRYGFSSDEAAKVVIPLDFEIKNKSYDLRLQRLNTLLKEHRIRWMISKFRRKKMT